MCLGSNTFALIYSVYKTEYNNVLTNVRSICIHPQIVHIYEQLFTIYYRLESFLSKYKIYTNINSNIEKIKKTSEPRPFIL